MDFQLARNNMVTQQIRPWHVLDDHVLAVLSEIPREQFVPNAYRHLAYCDTDIPLEEQQMMLSPKVVARALTALKLTGKEKVLEIGTGTGYITACLAKLAKTVVSIEIKAELLKQAQHCLSSLHYSNIILEQGDAINGWKALAPYDVIMVTGSYPLGIPEKLCHELKDNGRLFAVCGQAPAMQAILLEQVENTFCPQSLFETVVPALIHAVQPQTFHF